MQRIPPKVGVAALGESVVVPPGCLDAKNKDVALSDFTGSLAQPSSHSRLVWMSVIVGGLSTISYLLLAAAIVIRRRADPSLPAMDASSLTAVAICLTGFLFGVKYLIEHAAVDRRSQRPAALALTLTHLFGSLTLGLMASSLIVAAFPLVIALMTESMQRTLGGRFLPANLPDDAHALATDYGPQAPGEFPLLAVEETDWESANDEVIEEGLAADCTQRISRFRLAAGEVVSGQVRAEFASDEKTRVIHVAFCPPFAHQPKAEVFQTAGPEASIKQTLVEKFGMRLEIKLAGAPADNAMHAGHGHHELEDVVVEFLVECQKACA